MSLFPEPYRSQQCNAIVSERVLPLAENIRHKLIHKYCPASAQDKIIGNESDQDCLIRPYLGKRRTFWGHSRLNIFSLRNSCLPYGLDLRTTTRRWAVCTDNSRNIRHPMMDSTCRCKRCRIRSGSTTDRQRTSQMWCIPNFSALTSCGWTAATFVVLWKCLLMVWHKQSQRSSRTILSIHGQASRILEISGIGQYLQWHSSVRVVSCWMWRTWVWHVFGLKGWRQRLAGRSIYYDWAQVWVLFLGLLPRIAL